MHIYLQLFMNLTLETVQFKHTDLTTKLNDL